MKLFSVVYVSWFGIISPSFALSYTIYVTVVMFVKNFNKLKNFPWSMLALFFMSAWTLKWLSRHSHSSSQTFFYESQLNLTMIPISCLFSRPVFVRWKHLCLLFSCSQYLAQNMSEEMFGVLYFRKHFGVGIEISHWVEAWVGW